MDIKTKFSIGDRLWAVESDIVECSGCEVCDYTAIVIIKDREFGCPNCSFRSTLLYQPSEFIVSGIHISIDDEVISTYYDGEKYDQHSVSERDLFETINDAESEAEKRNESK